MNLLRLNNLNQCSRLIIIPYDAGSILSGKCDRIVSRGINLLDTNNYPAVLLGTNGTITNNGIKFRYTYSGTLNAYGIQFANIPVLPNTNYTASCLCELISGSYGAIPGIRVRFVQTNTYTSIIAGRWYASFNTGANTNVDLLFYAGSPVSNDVVMDISNVQLELAQPRLLMHHISTPEFPIPSEIQSLEGYGWSAGTAYNKFFKNQERRTHFDELTQTSKTKGQVEVV